MTWLAALVQLREQAEPGILVTLLDVRGHAPRAAGTKMVVAAASQWGSIGGGNLEATVVERAHALLAAGTASPERLHSTLTDVAPGVYGQQCCGGVVEVLLEPVAPVPVIAIFGLGHVGRELALLLSRHDIALHLVDSRAEYADPARLGPLVAPPATLRWHHAPWPDPVLTQLPRGTHVVIMTHDHAEDAALCDAALRHPDLASIGLIGSTAKWRRIGRMLAELGHDEAARRRITCPIGDPRVSGKEPPVIALSVAVALLDAITGRAPS